MKIDEIKCDCSYCTEKTSGKIRGNGKMVLNGVRFVCQNGQSTLEDHISRHPKIARAIESFPTMLAALKAALPLLPHASDDAKDVLHPVLGQVRAAISQADGKEVCIAWATRSASNGRIQRWSIVHRTVFGKYTLCGILVPHKKQIQFPVGHTDGRLSGRECKLCNHSKV